MSNEQDQTVLDPETGLVLRTDPFGGDSPDIVDWINQDDWEILEEDFGPVIDWPTTPVLAGRLANQKKVMIDHDDDRGETPTNIYSIIHAISKERLAFYGNYQLDQALGCPDPEAEEKSPYIGRDVIIKWQGKREQGKGGRTLNVYTVGVRREAITD